MGWGTTSGSGWQLLGVQVFRYNLNSTQKLHVPCSRIRPNRLIDEAEASQGTPDNTCHMFLPNVIRPVLQVHAYCICICACMHACRTMCLHACGSAHTRCIYRCICVYIYAHDQPANPHMWRLHVRCAFFAFLHCNAILCCALHTLYSVILHYKMYCTT